MGLNGCEKSEWVVVVCFVCVMVVVVIVMVGDVDVLAVVGELERDRQKTNVEH